MENSNMFTISEDTHLSDDKIAYELAYNTTSISGARKDKEKATYKRWLSGRIQKHKNIDILIERSKNLDEYLGANGMILNKCLFIINMNRHKGQKQQAKRFKFEHFSESFQKQADEYFSWKLESKTPKLPTQFKSLKAKERKFFSASNSSPWTLNSDGVSSSQVNNITGLKSFYTYAVSVCKINEPTIAMLFEADSLKDFINWALEFGSTSTANNALGFIIKEAKANTFTAQYLIPQKYETYQDWLEELEYAKFIATDLKANIERNRETLDGKRNIKFLLNNSGPWKIYNKLISTMRKIMNVKQNSLWTHASYLAFNWMIYCPLRIRNVSMLKWLGPISKNDIYKLEKNKEIGIFKIVETGDFGVFVHKSHLKNKKSKSINSICQGFSGLSSIFEDYVRARESELLRLNATSEYWVFGTSNKTVNGIGGRVDYSHTGRELVKLSQKALSVMYPHEYYPGINPHAIRHLAATLYLNDNPNNYVGLSTLLMDDLKTVLDVYANINRKKDNLDISEWASKRLNNAA